MMFWYGAHMGVGGWVLMTLFMLLFWGGLILAAFAIYRATVRDRSANDAARHLLDERFARGEIDVEEYAQRSKLLGAGR